MDGSACIIQIQGKFNPATCIISFYRRQANLIQADDVILLNIRNNDAMDGIEFDMYIQQSGTNGVLNQQALLQAVLVNLNTGRRSALL